MRNYPTNGYSLRVFIFGYTLLLILDFISASVDILSPMKNPDYASSFPSMPGERMKSFSRERYPPGFREASRYQDTTPTAPVVVGRRRIGLTNPVMGNPTPPTSPLRGMPPGKIPYPVSLGTENPITRRINRIVGNQKDAPLPPQQRAPQIPGVTSLVTPSGAPSPASSPLREQLRSPDYSSSDKNIIERVTDAVSDTINSKGTREAAYGVFNAAISSGLTDCTNSKAGAIRGAAGSRAFRVAVAACRIAKLINKDGVLTKSNRAANAQGLYKNVFDAQTATGDQREGNDWSVPTDATIPVKGKRSRNDEEETIKRQKQ